MKKENFISDESIDEVFGKIVSHYFLMSNFESDEKDVLYHMQLLQLIAIDKNTITIVPLGYKVIKQGGWLKYLKWEKKEKWRILAIPGAFALIAGALGAILTAWLTKSPNSLPATLTVSPTNQITFPQIEKIVHDTVYIKK